MDLGRYADICIPLKNERKLQANGVGYGYSDVCALVVPTDEILVT